MHMSQAFPYDEGGSRGQLPSHLADMLPEHIFNRLARTHYENFPVGSIFLPRYLRKHVFRIYAYCRICDDLADETGDPVLSAELLNWWRRELHDCYRGIFHQPLFAELFDTIKQYDLPMKPFDDLITAFLQDQRTLRYGTFDELLGYCRNSADPVGRLFLYLLGYRDESLHELSDCTCTALQLVNFWQDLSTDYEKGRIYLPREDMDRFGYSEDELANSIYNASFVRLMRFEIDRTRELFSRGAALARLIRGVGAADVQLFTDCGMALLRSIEGDGFNVYRKHIEVSSLRKCALAVLWTGRRLANALILRPVSTGR